MELFSKINVRDVKGLHYTHQSFEGHRVTSPGGVRVQSEAGVLHWRPQAFVAERAKSLDQQTEDLCKGKEEFALKISHLLTFT